MNRATDLCKAFFLNFYFCACFCWLSQGLLTGIVVSPEGAFRLVVTLLPTSPGKANSHPAIKLQLSTCFYFPFGVRISGFLVYVHCITIHLDCEQSLFFFGIVEGSARFAIARLASGEAAAARIEGAGPRKVYFTFFGLAPSFLAARSLAIANRALPSTIPKKNNDCSQYHTFVFS